MASSSSLSDQDQGLATQPFRWHYTELDDKNFQIHGRSLLLVIILFSLLLLFTLLCLYARWVCRYRRLFISSTSTSTSSSSTTNTTTNTTIATATQTDDPSSLIIIPSSNSSVGGLDPGVINRLPILLHHRSTKSSSTAVSDDDDNETQCSICLTTFQEQEKVKVLPDCQHSYHPECVDTWLTTHSNCPLCRASLRFFHNVENSTNISSNIP